MEQMYIRSKDKKNILSYVDFTRFCNAISQFSEWNIDILEKGCLRSFTQREKVLTDLEKYVKQINTRTYGDYTISENHFSQYFPFQRAAEKE